MIADAIPLRTRIDELLEEQQQLTAVERFSRQHENITGPAQERYYRDLIPSKRPDGATGEQYGFEVDLDACSGCKACVSACHSLNGLDEGESWRDVGQLNGIDTQQTVTTACHHCSDPACADGCPTLAYEKDSDTGIVRHLDDQCMGCRYCELKCPYEVPKYNDRLGIVRKCDMCQGRLAAGEAPACVQACPNEAIRIRIVPIDEIQSRSTADDRLLPGTFTSDYTRPATRFLNLRENSQPTHADADRLQPAHGHLPLAVMLACTQIGAGLITGEWALRLITQPSDRSWLPLALGLLIAFAGLSASVLHLGRPTQAWRAVLGWRKSWLSREILVFGPWAGAMLAFAATIALQLPTAMIATAGFAATALGLLGVFCSVKVYSDTRRALWSFPLTATRFLLTLFSVAFVFTPLPWIAALLRLPMLCSDLALFSGRLYPHLNKTSLLLRGPLRRSTRFRLVADVAAVLLLLVAPQFALPSLALIGIVELTARSLFFRAVEAPKMPGGLAH